MDVLEGHVLNVGFGCTVLAKGLRHGGVDGIGSYTRELGRHFTEDKSVNLVPVSFVAPSCEISACLAGAVHVIPHYARRAGVSALSPLSFPEDGLKDLDLFHATDHLIPKFANIPVVATLMDAIPLSHPEWVRMRFVHLKNWLWRRASHWADHVLTISECSKEDIARHFGISRNKISVVPLGVDERYFERFSPVQKEEVLRRLNLPEQFFLFVGTIQPRKNLERLLDAHASLPLRTQKEVPLVVVGRHGWGCEALVARMNEASLSGRVCWMKYLSDRDVRVLMQVARALVFPSLYEGFGLPVVEAFASGLPVITSNTTSLPEVAGDAALLVNPLDVGEIGEAMHQLVSFPAIADRLISAGEQRARALSWSACAQRTLDVYRQVLGAG